MITKDKSELRQAAVRSFLQSDEWAEFHKALGHRVISSSGKGWQYNAVYETGYGAVGRLFSRLYCPYGPFYLDAKALNEALADLEQRAKANHVDYVRVEPISANNDLFVGQYGYVKCQRNSQPELTLIIDLTKSFDELLLDMTKTNRYLWNKVDRLHLEFKTYYETQKLADFVAMLKETSERTGAKFHSQSYYETLFDVLAPSKTAGVAYVYHDGKALSGVLFVDDFAAKTRYYLYAGSFNESRRFSANSPLVTYLIKQAQANGFEKFDFFGLAPQDMPNHSWAGFSKFKRSFGGQELRFAGTWEKPIHKMRYRAMNVMRKFI